MDIVQQLREGIESRSPEQTAQVAHALAQVLPENCVLALYGDLGTGKTTFVRALAAAWGVKGHITSPSFGLYNIHNGQLRQLIHLDAYRLSGPDEFDALMLEEFLEPPWCLAVEWPQNIDGALPENAFKLEFSILPNASHFIRLLQAC